MTDNPNAKILSFVGYDLGRHVTLMLTFEPPVSGLLYKDTFPLCWERVEMGSTGTAEDHVKYTANTVCFLPQVYFMPFTTLEITDKVLQVEDSSDELTIQASNVQLCQIGQKCTVVDDGGSDVISKATIGEPSYLQCNNGTTRKVDIGIGFSDSTGRHNITHSVIFKSVISKATISAKLIPTLKIYESSKYHKSDIIKGDVDAPELWKQNLMMLEEVTTLDVTVDPIGGQAVIKVRQTT